MHTLRLVVLVAVSSVLSGCFRAERELMRSRVSEAYPDKEERELARAAFDGKVSQLSELLTKGVAIDCIGLDGSTPLWWAIGGRQKSTFWELLRFGADPNTNMSDGFNIMEMGAYESDRYYLGELLSHGGKVELVSEDTGFTPIFTAILAKNLKNVEFLVGNGADINFRDSYNETPLIHAALVGSYDIAYYLLNNGADSMVVAKGGYSFGSLAHKSRIDESYPMWTWLQKCLNFLEMSKSGSNNPVQETPAKTAAPDL